MSVVLAAAAAEQSAGWGHLVALVGAGVVFWAGSSAHQRWLSTREDHSPTAIEGTKVGVKTQVRPGFDTTSDTGSGSGRPRTAGLDEWARKWGGRRPNAAQVAQAMARYKASRRTVYRALDRAAQPLEVGS